MSAHDILVYEISRRLVNEKTRTMKSVWAAETRSRGIDLVKRMEESCAFGVTSSLPSSSRSAPSGRSWQSPHWPPLRRPPRPPPQWHQVTPHPVPSSTWGEISRPASRPPSIHPIGCGPLAFARQCREICGRAENFLSGHSPVPFAGHLAAVSVTAGPSAKRCTRIAILISSCQ
jgi:hypothetical protein